MKKTQNKIYDIRYENLRRIVRIIGNQGIIAKKLDISAAYLSRLCNPKNRRRIYDDLARRIETAFNKPSGWLDIKNIDFSHIG